jgi:flagellar hook-associated protein FlgK
LEDIENGFKQINERLDELEAMSDERHTDVVDKLRNLIKELHEEDVLDFDRDDIK